MTVAVKLGRQDRQQTITRLQYPTQGINAIDVLRYGGVFYRHEQLVWPVVGLLNVLLRHLLPRVPEALRELETATD